MADGQKVNPYTNIIGIGSEKKPDGRLGLIISVIFVIFKCIAKLRPWLKRHNGL